MKWVLTWNKFAKKGTLNKTKMIAHAFLFTNFVFVALARGNGFLFAFVIEKGLYTPFLCWYFYSFPLLLAISKVGCVLGGSLWLLHEILFRFFGNLKVEMYATFFYFLINTFVIARTILKFPTFFVEKYPPLKKEL